MPAVILILFIVSEAFLKRYIRDLQPAGSLLFLLSLPLFLFCLVYFLRYFRRKEKGDYWEDLTKPVAKPGWHLMALVAVLLLGCLLRFWKLGNLFDGMTYDESYKGLDAIAIRQYGERPVFLDWNGGREALIAYLVAGSQSIFDYTSSSVRVITALAGCLTLIFFYLFAKAVLKHRVALLSVFLLAVSKWHIIHSRYGVRAGLYLLFEVAALYFVARALLMNKKHHQSFLWAGLIVGLGFYTYIAYRIFPLVVLAFLLQPHLWSRLKEQRKAILAAGLLFLVVIAPLGVYYAQHHQSFTDRMKRTLVWRNQESAEALQVTAKSTMDTLGMFTYAGDVIARHNVGNEPMLSPFSTSFFILGFFLALLHLRKPYAGFLITYLFLTLLPGVLSVGAPNVPRVLGSLPPATLFTGFGIITSVELVVRYSGQLARILLAMILAGNLITGVNDALFRQPAILDSLPTKISSLWGMDRDQQDVAELLNQLGENCEAYLAPQFFFHSTIEYLTYSKSRHRLLTPDADFQKSSGKVIVVFVQPHLINPWWLRDDDGKKFFKWWNQYYGLDTVFIRSLNRNTYNPPMTNSSDRKLIRILERRYPAAKHLDFGHFTALIFQTKG